MQKINWRRGKKAGFCTEKDRREKKKTFNTLIKNLNRKQKSSLDSKKKYIKIVIDDADHYNYLKSFEENIKAVCERRKIPEKYRNMMLKEWKQNPKLEKYKKAAVCR